MFVYFNGFRYGQSGGIGFDPTIVIPCTYTPLQNDGTPTPTSIDDDNSISFSNLFLGFFIISIVALTVIIMKNKKTVRF